VEKEKRFFKFYTFIKYFLLITSYALIKGCSVTSGKEANIYLANNDSIYICESKTFNSQKIYSSDLSDKVFIQKALSKISVDKYEILLKPMTSFNANGNGVGEAIENFCKTLKQNNINYKIVESDSAEKEYFDAVTILEFLRNK
jgi:hypothetical protein